MKYEHNGSAIGDGTPLVGIGRDVAARVVAQLRNNIAPEMIFHRYSGFGSVGQATGVGGCVQYQTLRPTSGICAKDRFRKRWEAQDPDPLAVIRAAQAQTFATSGALSRDTLFES